MSITHATLAELFRDENGNFLDLQFKISKNVTDRNSTVTCKNNIFSISTFQRVSSAIIEKLIHVKSCKKRGGGGQGSFKAATFSRQNDARSVFSVVKQLLFTPREGRRRGVEASFLKNSFCGIFNFKTTDPNAPLPRSKNP